jgi:hypothetical protein
MNTILLNILLILLISALPTWPYSGGFGRRRVPRTMRTDPSNILSRESGLRGPRAVIATLIPATSLQRLGSPSDGLGK